MSLGANSEARGAEHHFSLRKQEQSQSCSCKVEETEGKKLRSRLSACQTSVRERASYTAEQDTICLGSTQIERGEMEVFLDG